MGNYMVQSRLSASKIRKGLAKDGSLRRLFWGMCFLAVGVAAGAASMARALCPGLPGFLGLRVLGFRV